MLTLRVNSCLVYPFCSLCSALREVDHSEYLDMEVHLHNNIIIIIIATKFIYGMNITVFTKSANFPEDNTKGPNIRG